MEKFKLISSNRGQYAPIKTFRWLYGKIFFVIYTYVNERADWSFPFVLPLVCFSFLNSERTRILSMVGETSAFVFRSVTDFGSLFSEVIRVLVLLRFRLLLIWKWKSWGAANRTKKTSLVWDCKFFKVVGAVVPFFPGSVRSFAVFTAKKK